jgi:regulator of replication initiation timing
LSKKILFLNQVRIYDAFMKKILKFVLVILGFRYVLRLMDENVDIKIQIKKLRNELANLETEDLENKIKDFFKKYDPKFKDQEENQEDF